MMDFEAVRGFFWMAGIGVVLSAGAFLYWVAWPYIRKTYRKVRRGEQN